MEKSELTFLLRCVVCHVVSYNRSLQARSIQVHSCRRLATLELHYNLALALQLLVPIEGLIRPSDRDAPPLRDIVVFDPEL